MVRLPSLPLMEEAMIVSLTQQGPLLSIGRSAYMQIRRFPHVGLSDLHNFNIFKEKKFDVETAYSIGLQLLHPNWWGRSESSRSTPDCILRGHPRLKLFI